MKPASLYFNHLLDKGVVGKIKAIKQKTCKETLFTRQESLCIKIWLDARWARFRQRRHPRWETGKKFDASTIYRWSRIACCVYPRVRKVASFGRTCQLFRRSLNQRLKRAAAASPWICFFSWMNFISSRKNKRGKRPRKVRNRKVMRGAFQMSLREVESKPWVRMRKREREKGVSLLKEPCEEEIKTHHRRDRFSICPRLHHSFSLSLVHCLSGYLIGNQAKIILIPALHRAWDMNSGP